MQYYATFTENGERITTFIIGVNCNEPPEGSILISEEEQQLYMTNNYIRNMSTGLPILKPILPLTLDEQAAAIEAKYKPKLDNYKELILSTIAVDGSSQASKTTYFQTKYNEELTKQNNELEALYL